MSLRTTELYSRAGPCSVQEWEDAKKKQDKALDGIEKGLTTLKGIGEAMGESISQQDVVIDAIDEKVTLCRGMRLAGISTDENLRCMHNVVFCR